MSKLTHLADEICAGAEIYFTGRTDGQYLKTAFILCDDYTELASKLYLIEMMRIGACLVLGLMTEDLCDSLSAEVLILNEPGAEIPAGQVGLPLVSCTRGGTETGVNETDTSAPINLSGGGELTVSSE